LDDPAVKKIPWGSVSLVVAFVGWLVANLLDWPPGVPTELLRAFFDGSLAGALADWFAVTALFRKPAGLPLPHTDLLVRRKEDLARAIPEFLGQFLETSSLAPLVQKLDFAASLESHFDLAQLSDLFAKPEAAQWSQQALTAASKILLEDLRRRRPELVDPLTAMVKRRAGWKGLFVGTDTVDEMLQGLLDELEAFHADLSHPLRPLLIRAAAEALSRWGEEKPWGRTDASRAAFNHQASNMVLQFWEVTRVPERLSASLTYVLMHTDARQLSERIRSAVGQDLQAIRVNGALVGGIAGVLLSQCAHLILGR